MNFFLIPFYKIIFTITTQIPLSILNATFKLIGFFNSKMIINLIFPGGGFTFDNLTPFFEFVLYLTSFVGLVALIGRWLYLTMKSNASSYEKLTNSIKNLFIGIVIILIIPAVFYGYATLNLIINKAIEKSHLSNSFNLANLIFHISVFKPGLNLLDVIDYSANDFAISNEAIVNFNFVIAWVGIFFSFKFAIKMIEMVLFSIFWLFNLFIISPLVVLFMILDNMNKITIWQTKVKQKFGENFLANFMILVFSFLMSEIMVSFSNQSELPPLAIKVLMLFVFAALSENVTPIVDWILKLFGSGEGVSSPFEKSLSGKLASGLATMGGFSKNLLFGKEKSTLSPTKGGKMSLVSKRTGGLVGKVAKTGLGLAKGAAIGGGWLGLVGATGKMIARNAASNMFQGSKVGAAMGFINENKLSTLKTKRTNARSAAGKLTKATDKASILKRKAEFDKIKNLNQQIKKTEGKVKKRNAWKERNEK